ncbi:response regulator [Iningainema tapete]|nr:response regulator [Iningainema tapete]
MTITKLTEELNNLSKYGDGELTITSSAVTWKLYLVRGQLLYATGEVHPVRRWDRALKQHCPKWNWCAETSHLTSNESWEYHLLELGLSQKRLSLIQANSVIRTVFQECLFDLITYTDFISDWKPGEKAISTLCRVVSLSVQGMQSVLIKATQTQRKWLTSGLGNFSPILAPILQSGGYRQAPPVLEKYLNGMYTLWDIAWQLEKSVTEVACSLMPFVDKGILQFQNIPDLALPTIKPLIPTKFISPKSLQKQALIACIDDSTVLTHTLKKILVPAGYEVLIIPEPMRGFGQLIEHKPDLILLDLLLPNADGYSVCKFLRETPAFKNTPILILTAKNSPIDRVRAQLAGATEFLSKPPQPQELLHMVEKYLGQGHTLNQVKSF